MYKTCSHCKKDKSFSDFSKDKSRSDGLECWCRLCRKEKKKEYRYKNKKKLAEYDKKYYRQNKEYPLGYYYSNRERILEKQRLAYKNNYGNNKHKYTAKAGRRRASKISATPKWLTESHLKEIESIYWLAQDLRAITGEDYEVDHIVPLQGKNICGLHVPWNLQILPKDLNRQKSNSFNED